MESIDYSAYKNSLKHYESHGHKVAYFDKGEGPVILLLHGVPTSSWLYRKICPPLLSAGFRVIAPDMLGYGASDKPTDLSIYEIDKMGKLLLNLMDHLNIDSWSHVFHDAGGLWTWEMLKQDATKVNHLFMLNTIVYQSGFNPPIKFKEGYIAKKYAQLYANKLGQKIILSPTFRNGILNRKVINNQMLEGYNAPLRNQYSSGIYYFFARTGYALPDYSDLHKSLNIPLTVIWGEKDKVLNWKKIENEVRTNFGSNLKDVHMLDAKHFIQEEQPHKVADIIISNSR